MVECEGCWKEWAIVLLPGSSDCVSSYRSRDRIYKVSKDD